MAVADEYPVTALKDALGRIDAAISRTGAVAQLEASAEATSEALGALWLAEVPAFSESANPDTLDELTRHGPEHIREIVRLVAGASPGDLGFVRRHARRRAEQRFPLEATLHAYRCAHRLFSRWLRDAIRATPAGIDSPEAVAAVADFTLEYTNAISTVFASDYVVQTRLLADVAGDRRTELLNILLEGFDESDGRVEKILREAGYLDRRQSFCVVLARSVDPAEMNNAARARRLADAVDRVLADARTRRVTDVRDNRVIAVFSDARRASGWTAPHTVLADRVTSALEMLGNAVLVGVSNDVPSTSQIPMAHKEALVALELADVTQRVVQYAAIPTRRLLLHMAGEEFQRVLPAWADALFAADDRSRGALAQTLRAYADADMNVRRAAEALAIHPNTLYARLRRVQDLAGRDARSFHALTELLIALDCRP